MLSSLMLRCQFYVMLIRAVRSGVAAFAVRGGPEFDAPRSQSRPTLR